MMLVKNMSLRGRTKRGRSNRKIEQSVQYYDCHGRSTPSQLYMSSNDRGKCPPLTPALFQKEGEENQNNPRFKVTGGKVPRPVRTVILSESEESQNKGKVMRSFG